MLGKSASEEFYKSFRGDYKAETKKENCEEGMEIRVAEENRDCDRSSLFIGRLGASADEIKLQEEKQL